MATGSRPLRWGIVSTARINASVIPALRAASRAELVAVASRRQARADEYAARTEIPTAYGEALLADASIDCVYVSVPNSEHAAVATAALAAGKHVLCEKPLATSREEGVTLFERARDADRVLMEAFMYRHHDKARRLRELVQGGSLGSIQVIRSTFHFRVDDPSNDIRYRPELGGGALRDVGCYCTSLASYLLDDVPVSVEGAAELASTGVEESFVGVLTFPDGARCQFACGMQTELDIGVTVEGSEARAYLGTPWYPHLPPPEIEVWRGGERATIETSAADPYRLEVENFCAVVDGEREQEVTPDETLSNLGVMDDLAAAAGLPQYQINPKGPVLL
jgi:predicted dehydrogenase